MNRTQQLKQIKLEKKAQQAIKEVKDDSEDYGHKIFEKLLEQIELEGFEDVE